MLFFLAAAALQPLVALAAPSATEPLSVPVSDLTKRDFSGHEEHPYFGVFQRWLESPAGAPISRDTDAFLEEHSNLVSIECRADNDNCLLWANAHDLFISTHLKTYKGNDEDVKTPIGHEHYLDANIRCGTLDYRSTGFTLDNFEVLYKSACQTQLWIDGKEEYFDRDSTCEYIAAHSVKEQECEDYSGGGWCGVHVTQYQKNQGPGMTPEHYRFTVNIKDKKGKPIDEHDLVPIPSRETREFNSLLPEPFKVYSPDVNSDAIWMHYKDQYFTSNDQAHHCNFRKYNSGYREGDCGFTC